MGAGNQEFMLTAARALRSTSFLLPPRPAAMKALNRSGKLMVMGHGFFATRSSVWEWDPLRELGVAGGLEKGVKGLTRVAGRTRDTVQRSADTA